jgi:hypothetical protein
MLPRIKIAVTMPQTVQMGAQTRQMPVMVNQNVVPRAPNPGARQALTPVSTEGLKGRMAMNGLLPQTSDPSTGYQIRGRGGVSARGALADASGGSGAGMQPRITPGGDLRNKIVSSETGRFFKRQSPYAAAAKGSVGQAAAGAATGARGLLSKGLGMLKWPLGLAGAYGAYKMLTAPSEHQDYMRAGGIPYVQM